MISVRVGNSPEVVEEDQNFENLYSFLNCTTIQVIPIGEGYSIVCDEEGTFVNKPLNACGIVGDFLLVGKVKRGYFSSLSESEITALEEYWKENRNNRQGRVGNIR